MLILALSTKFHNTAQEQERSELDLVLLNHVVSVETPDKDDEVRS